MPKKTILIAAPAAFGALILFWASLVAREEPATSPAPAKKAVRTSPAPASAAAVIVPSEVPGPAPAEVEPPRPSATPESAAILARIRALEERQADLEAKRDLLSAANRQLEKEAAEKWAAASARSTAEWRVRAWEGLLGLGEEQKQGLIELWTKWARDDAGRPAGRDVWAAREAELRPRLTAEQSVRLSESVSKQAAAMWSQMGRTLGGMAGLATKDEQARLQPAIGDLRLPAGLLLAEANGADWPELMKEAVSRVRPLLTAEQAGRLEKHGVNR